MKSRLYLVRLFYASKFLFVAVLVFAILNLAVNIIYKAEQTPFFLWDLYSHRLAHQKTHSFLEIRYNKNEVLLFPHTWDEPKKLFFTNTLNYFIWMKENNDTDPYKAYMDHWNNNHPSFIKKLPGLKLYNDTAEVKKFPIWYKKYLGQHLKKPVYSIDIYTVNVAYPRNGDVKKLSSTHIYKLL